MLIQSFKVLGILDIKNVPCARESLLYGTLGALAVGLGHFLATSKQSETILSLRNGRFCSDNIRIYNNAKLRIQQRMLQEAVRNKILFESTPFDPGKKTVTNSEGSRS
ncbi:Cytochrome c oxidase assembly protein COX20, mitochondrial, partial [Varanus komodoensis]